jgi:hypothetical protein
MQNIYLKLTDEFNSEQFRAIICSGQAVVLHKLAVMSKDGDWIIREDKDALNHIVQTLAARKASYRFGVPLDVRWMAGGWSAHLEFMDEFRVRTDFFTRPPRISGNSLNRIWNEQEKSEIPFLDPPDLAELKKTNRDMDYSVIGELARIMKDPADQLLFSRSARDLIRLAGQHPELATRLAVERPQLKMIDSGEENLARALDEERREYIRQNEVRLQRYAKASGEWRAVWPELRRKIENCPLPESHAVMVEGAEKLLPFTVEDHDG